MTGCQRCYVMGYLSRVALFTVHSGFGSMDQILSCALSKISIKSLTHMQRLILKDYCQDLSS